MLRSSFAAAIAIDGDGGVIEFNPAAEAIFGHRREDVLGRPLDELITPPLLGDAHPGWLRRYLRSARSRLIGRRTDQVAVRADGERFPVELAIVPLPTDDAPAFVCFIRDISRRRRAEERLARHEALLADAEDLAGAGSFEVDLRTGKREWSGGMYRVLGLAPGAPPSVEEMLARMHPRDRVTLEEGLKPLSSGASQQLCEHIRIARPDGDVRWLEFLARVEVDGFGTPRRLLGTVRDVTEEEQARHARDLLSYVVDSTDDAILTKSSDGTITSWNRGAERLYGYTAEEAVGRSVSMLVAPELMEDQVRLTRRVFAGESIRHYETERVHSNGSTVAVSLTLSPVRDRTGEIVSAAVIARDVTERRRYERRLQHLADHDPLTGLFNRRRFEAELRREVSRSERSGEALTVLSLDLDGFKAINDSAGHAAGDTVLASVARALQGHVRDSDFLARLGGDEFAVLLPGADLAAARSAAEHLLDTLHGCRVEIEGTPFRVTASIGGVVRGPGAGRSEELVVGADLAMYEAKQQGRDRIAIFSAEQAQAARADARLSWSQRIRHALEHDGLLLHWQPIVELASGDVSHGELLLRMCSDGGIVLPAAFLQAAERLGLIHAIDRWVVQRAIQLLATGAGPAARPLSANLSGETVAGDRELLGLIERELDATGVDPSMLIFEVTETAAIANIADARMFAQGLHELGCRLALDDFGTGFGSFYHLKHLPVDFLKIDREFVHNLPRSEVDQRLVRSIVDVAHALEVSTVAESVGDEATIELLREIGVDYIQGFHVAEPMPVDLPARP
jgi:diguanylate cyclase (GGDEF)-like protein/PAS domain S-box-containing protein